MGHLSFMKKENQNNQAELLELLKKVLPKATHDAQLAGKIYQAIEQELNAKSRSRAFEKFCDKVHLPDLEPQSVNEAKKQLAAAFGEGDLTIKPNRKDKSLMVELALPDGAQFISEIKVNQNGAAETSDEQEIILKFVPFPVCLPGDQELIWLLSKRENMSAEEAGIALSKVEEEFWASKSGQKMIRDRVERSFPEFIGRVPAGMLGEAGLKRHYKTPETLKVLRQLRKARKETARV
jgi:hypothetical protein